MSTVMVSLKPYDVRPGDRLAASGQIVTSVDLDTRHGPPFRRYLIRLESGRAVLRSRAVQVWRERPQ
jgi:hypothetical protein